MKKSFAIKGAIAVVLLGVLAAVGPGGGVLNFGLLADEEEPPPTNPGNGKLAATDLNTDGEEGWQEIILPPDPAEETAQTKGKPRQSSFDFAAEFVCYQAPEEEGGELVPVVTQFQPAQDEAANHEGAFRRKTSIGPQGGSKLLAQRVAEFQNDGGGGMTGVEKARAVLEQLRAILSDPDCVELEWRTQDPPSAASGNQPAVRVWDVVPQPDPDLGDTPGPGENKRSLHFRVLSQIGSADDPEADEPLAVPIENDVVVIQRGRTLILMFETSPGGYPDAVTEALNHAGKADQKMNTHGGSGA